MALYEYACSACKTKFDLRVPMSEVQQEVPCKNCGKTARKTLGNFALVGIGSSSFDDFDFEDGDDGAGDGDFDPSMEGIDF